MIWWGDGVERGEHIKMPLTDGLESAHIIYVAQNEIAPNFTPLTKLNYLRTSKKKIKKVIIDKAVMAVAHICPLAINEPS